jgi:DNA polymerase-1
MHIIQTDKVSPNSLKTHEREWIYNGLDCCITAEVFDVLSSQLEPTTSRTYSFSRALQGPVLEMRLRGVRIDAARKAQVVDEYYERLSTLEDNLERIIREGVGFYGFNWRSNAHLKELFYDRLGIPEIKRQGRVTVNRDALEKMEFYLVAKQIVRHMMAMRELAKKISVLKTGVDPDGRIRTSYNIAGTNTFRFSSSLSEFGTGGNLQNIEEGLRSIFISDPGYKMAYIDAQQIQSRIVGAIEWNLFHDGKYLDACESGDLHTTVARMCWPKDGWTGVLDHDRELAELPYYRHYSKRFMCKKIGHGTNFMGKPYTIATQTKIDEDVIRDFQPVYFLAFPAHLRWHEWVKRTIYTEGVIHSITGNRRQFWGRRDSEDTYREAVAYDPQCSEAHIVNNGMLNVWRARDAQLLMQNHDAIIVQYPEEREDEIIPKIKAQLRYPVALSHDRELVIPYDCQTGWNWGHYDAKKNPDGLKSYVPGDKRKRAEEVSILDRPIRSRNR